MSDRRNKPILLNNQAAKIVRRRRTADEAGLSLTANFDTKEPRPRWPKIQKRIDLIEHLVETKEENVEKDIKHAPLESRRSGNIIDSNTNGNACDWPMSVKEKAQPSHVGRRMDEAAGINVAFPLVYDITQSMSDMNEDQTMDADMMDNLIDTTESCQIPTDGANIDFNSVLSQLRCFQGGLPAKKKTTVRRRGSIDSPNLRTAMTAFSKLTVSERTKSSTACTKSKKRPVYLLIIFATFDADHRLKCDAYITCVNRIPNGRSHQRFGMNWIMSQLMEMFEQQQATNGRFNHGNRQWLIACCLVEALTHNPRFLTVNAYWRQTRDGIGNSSPIEFFRQIANHLSSQNGIQHNITSTELANRFTAIAVNVANQLSLASGEKNMLKFDEKSHSSPTNDDSLYENLTLMAMMSRAACWLIEEFNRLNVQQLITPPISSEIIPNRLS